MEIKGTPAGHLKKIKFAPPPKKKSSAVILLCFCSFFPQQKGGLPACPKPRKASKKIIKSLLFIVPFCSNLSFSLFFPPPPPLQPPWSASGPPVWSNTPQKTIRKRNTTLYGKKLPCVYIYTYI